MKAKHQSPRLLQKIIGVDHVLCHESKSSNDAVWIIKNNLTQSAHFLIGGKKKKKKSAHFLAIKYTRYVHDIVKDLMEY